MKKLTLLMAAIFALVAFPAVASAAYSNDTDGDGVVDNQSVNENSNIDLDVLAAIELAAPADDVDEEVAPDSGLDQAGVVDPTITFETSADLRSNLSWAVATTLSDGDAMQGGSTGTQGLLDTVVIDDSAANGDRNQAGAQGVGGNDAQTYSNEYDQDVSWGDEAGTYDIVATHTATQTLAD